MTAMAALVAALFFLRFWKQTRDPLFLTFAVAFAMEALSRIILAQSPSPHEGAVLPYTVRFLAYALILVGIIQKNLTRRS